MPFKHRTSRKGRAGDAGFSIVEIVVSIVLMGTVVVAVLNAVGDQRQGVVGQSFRGAGRDGHRQRGGPCEPCTAELRLHDLRAGGRADRRVGEGNGLGHRSSTTCPAPMPSIPARGSTGATRIRGLRRDRTRPQLLVQTSHGLDRQPRRPGSSLNRGGEVQCLIVIRFSEHVSGHRDDGMTLVELLVSVVDARAAHDRAVERDHRHAAPTGQHRGPPQRRPRRADDQHVDSGGPRIGRARSTPARRLHRAVRPSATAIDLSGGSNVMMLTWTSDNGDGTTTTTNVSYHFAPSGDGATYNLSRVECNVHRRGVDLLQPDRPA